jgi:hypothetical protein
MYALVIAQIMLVMTYSAAIPFLYLTLPIFCFMMFWTEKYLFLRFHRNVPLYATDIVLKVVRISEYAVLIHLNVGLLMFTTPEFFSPDPSAKLTAPRYAR